MKKGFVLFLLLFAGLTTFAQSQTPQWTRVPRANFTPNSYEVSIKADPAQGGTVAFGSGADLIYDFEDGIQGWTILQGANSTSPNNWHHNSTHVSYNGTTQHDWSSFGHNNSSGFMMSESYISSTTPGGTAYGAVTPDNYLISPQVRLGGSISFYAGAKNTNYCAEKFSVMVSTTDNTSTDSFTTLETWILSLPSAGYTSSPYTVDLSAYAGQMGYVAIRHWDCYDQWVLCIDDITIVEGENNTISDDSGTFYYGESCTVTATPSMGYYFLNWAENGTAVSTSASYTFTVTSDRDLVAHFTDEMPTQTVTLASGWNWWSTNLDITLDQLKAAVVAAVGANGTAIIKSQGGSITYQSGMWRPATLDFDIRNMYEIYVNSNCEITLSGTQVNPSEYEITIHNGVNWIGFLPNESMTLDEAFGSFPVVGDMVKSKGGSATYTGNGWRPAFNLEPGNGYIYQSNVSEDRTFTFPTNAQ